MDKNTESNGGNLYTFLHDIGGILLVLYLCPKVFQQ